VLTSPSDCGAATLPLPQDMQAEACDYRRNPSATRVADPPGPSHEVSFDRAVEAIRASRKPLIVAGGGVR
jgi:3D-(3,5/4)-trihydroxycyclohexane-1,2-dione acylhydrolase (decyclizing)